MCARRQEVERERGERPGGEERRRIAPPPQRRARGDEPDDQEGAADGDVAVVWLPEIADDRPDVERIEARVRVRRGRGADELDELGRADAERNAERKDRDERRDARAHRRPPVRVADPLDERGRGDDDERDPELRLDHERDAGDDAGERPAPPAGEHERAHERHGAHRVDLSPVGPREDRTGREHPESGREHRAGASGRAPRDRRAEDGDRDVGRDGHRLDGEPQQLPVEERAQEPQDVQVSRRVVAEVSRLVEPPRPELREALGPGLERRDVARESRRPQHEQARHDAERDDARDREARAPVRARRVGRFRHCQYPKRVIAIVAYRLIATERTATPMKSHDGRARQPSAVRASPASASAMRNGCASRLKR